MTTIELQLKASQHRTESNTGWFVAGAEPASWLEVICGLWTQHDDVRVLVLNDRQTHVVYGAVVVGPQAAGRRSLAAIPLNEAHRGFWMAAEGQLFPDVMAADYEKDLDDQHFHVWLPRTGYVRFAQEEQLRVSDLLVPLRSTDRRWDLARPGTQVSHRMGQLGPAVEMTFEEFLKEARGDIGSEAGQGSGGMMGKFSQMLGAGENSWMKKASDWADDKIFNEREKELNRLMKMLEDDPDEGLRHAVSLNNLGGQRGSAPPTSRLGSRPVNFSLSSLFGSAPGDSWDISADRYLRLQERYRQLATRELQLGRYRRAAYIFAQLLGDLHAAANALVTGEHFQEAAVVYRDKLGIPQEAAKCLKQGGLYLDAIKIYMELREFEEVGDLYTKLGDEESAKTAYLDAVTKQRNMSDHLGAARLCRLKLHDDQLAMEELARGWPNSRQRKECLESIFDLLGSLGRHGDALDWVKRLHSDLKPSEQSVAIKTLVDISQNYPSHDVRSQARLQSLIVSSSALKRGNKELASAVLSSLPGIASSDRLLERDCQRFGRVRVNRRRLTKQPNSLHVQLRSTIDWRTATANDNGILVAGIEDEQFLVVAEVTWDGVDKFHENARWKIEPHLINNPILFVVRTDFDRRPLLHLTGGQPLPSLPISSLGTTEETIRIGGMHGLSPNTVLVGRSNDGVTWVLDYLDGNLILSSLSWPGSMQSTHSITFSKAVSHFGNFGMRDGCFHYSTDNGVCMFRPAASSDDIDYFDMASDVSGIVASLPSSHQSYIVVGLEFGARVYWSGRPSGDLDTFAADIEYPKLVLGRQFCTVVGSNEARVYQFRDRSVKYERTLQTNVEEPIAALGSKYPAQFAVVGVDGRVSICKW